MGSKEQEQEPVADWLTAEFVEKTLEEDQGRLVSVEGTTVTRAVGKGDNYGSLLLRVDVRFRPKQGEGAGEQQRTSLVVKSLPEGELMQEWIRESGVFQREARVYNEALPRLYRALEAAGVGLAPAPPPVCFAAHALPCARDHTLVLEDLRDLGFRMSSRHMGLDLEHAKLVLRNLATFHAASVAAHATDPESMESFNEPFYREDKRQEMERFVPITYNNLAKTVESWGNEYVTYAEKLRAFSQRAIDVIMEVIKSKDGFLCVLNHGDCWVNNCLFRYSEEGHLRDMRFVDFQLTRWASPALDLQYLLYTSVSGDVRDENWNDLLGEYVSTLGSALRALGHEDKLFSLDELQREMDAKAAFGLMSACTVLAAVVADPNEAMDLSSVTKESLEKGDLSFFDKAMDGSRFRNALQRLLPHFVEKGVL